SIYNREKQLMAISPSGMDYFSITPKDVVIMDLEGNIIDSSKSPSSEYHMHSIFYKNREDINAVVHTHSVYSSVLATLREKLPASSYLVAFSGMDVQCAEYASFGSYELAENAYNAMGDRKAVFLANHGLLTGSNNLANAFNIAEQIEHCAEVYYRARCIGKPMLLDDKEMKKMIDKFSTYGQIKVEK
ncbi:MAG: L-fuculose-phosphate aldolase, partial [Peptostreptococcaceae bacterium]